MKEKTSLSLSLSRYGAAIVAIDISQERESYSWDQLKMSAENSLTEIITLITN